MLIVKSKQKSRRRTSKIPTDVLGEKRNEVEEAMKLSLSALPSWPIYFNYLRLLPSRVSCLHETPTHSHTLSLSVGVWALRLVILRVAVSRLGLPLLPLGGLQSVADTQKDGGSEGGRKILGVQS